MAAPLDPRLVRRARATLPFLVALCVVGVGTALLILAAVGLTRRAEIVLPEVVLSATWTSVSVAAWWTATRSKLPPPPKDRE